MFVIPVSFVITLFFNFFIRSQGYNLLTFILTFKYIYYEQTIVKSFFLRKTIICLDSIAL